VKPVPRTLRPASILVAALALSAFGGVGFLVGRTNQTSAASVAGAGASAAANSYVRAEANAYQLSWRVAYQRGWVAGIASGTTTGTRAGGAAGRTEAAKRTAAASVLAAALASTPTKLTRSTKTDTCVPVRGGLCEVLGPGVTGKRCPPASVPYPQGGVVCVPSVVVLAARIANAPNVDLLTP
jgi:hypothetical protein